MKYKILLVLLILFPILVSAECNQTKHKEYLELAENITYDNNYNKSSSTYTFVVYNITKEMYVTYGKNNYKSDNENKVVISNIKEGTNISIRVYVDDGCDPIKFYGLSEPYFNPYYNSKECFGFESLSECSKEFTSSKVTKELLEKAKYYYYQNYNSNNIDDGQEMQKSILEIIKEYISKWWVKVILSLVTIILSISIYRTILRKIKHGI